MTETLKRCWCESHPLWDNVWYYHHVDDRLKCLKHRFAPHTAGYIFAAKTCLLCHIKAHDCKMCNNSRRVALDYKSADEKEFNEWFPDNTIQNMADYVHVKWCLPGPELCYNRYCVVPEPLKKRKAVRPSPITPLPAIFE